MKKTLILLVSVFTLMTANCQENNADYLVQDIPLMNEWHNVNFYHVNYTSLKKNIGDSIQFGEQIGEVEAEPESYSDFFDKEIKQSMIFYGQKNYKKAIDVLKKAIVEESNNFFVLNNFARACYWVDKEKSYEVYQRLINGLDSVHYEADQPVSVDLWFREAYWKLGTLYMDISLYENAYYEISRSLVCMQDMKSESIYSQAMEYMTECAYMMHDEPLALHLAERTLFYDPENAYAKDVIKKLNE